MLATWQLKTSIPSYLRHTWTYGSETCHGVRATNCIQTVLLYLLKHFTSFVHSLHKVQGRVSCLKYLKRFLVQFCIHGPKLKDAALLIGSPQRRRPRSRKKIILKSILKNFDVLVGLDLSGFNMSPCIHAHSFSCLFYLLGLSCSSL